MAQPYYSSNKEFSFSQIILSQVKDVLKLMQHEYRGGFFEKKYSGNMLETIYIPDSRKAVIQSVEGLKCVLFPHFNEKMKESYEKILEELETNLEEYNKSKKEDKDRSKFIMNKLDLMIEMFQALNVLLKDTDYLKSSDYTESIKQLEEEGELIE